MDTGAVFVATCIAAAVSTMVMALYANYPIALAPGMGLNAFFAFTVVLGYKYTWQQALAAVFCSGVLFFLISIFRIREYRHQRHPEESEARDLGRRRPVPRASSRWRRPRSWSRIRRRWCTLGDLKQWPAILCLLGFVLIAALNYRKVIGGTVIGILVVTLIGLPLGLAQFSGIVSVPPSLAPTFLQLDFSRHGRADLHHRRVQLPAGRRVRQRRHADRRHPSRRPARQGRQPAAHAAGADRRQLRRHVRLADRHLDHHELYRERGRRLGRRPHRADGRCSSRCSFCWRCCSRRSPAWCRPMRRRRRCSTSPA